MRCSRARDDDRVNLAEKLAAFGEHWSPKIVAELNDYDVQVVKLKGEFVWHKHDDTDDFFLVLKGRRPSSSGTATSTCKTASSS